MLNTVNCFMGLLSAGINQTTYNLEELLSVDEWDMLYKNSMDQNVLPIIYEQLIYSGVFELADKLLKSKYNQLYEEAFAAIRYREMFREQMIAFTSSQIQRTEQFYEYYAGMLQLGLHPVIVKGIICRNLYPEPDLRPSGDEDIYVQLDEYPKLKQFLLKNGFALTEKSRSETMLEELEFLNVMKGVLYEVHTTLMPRTSTFYDKHNVVFENAFENAVIEVINGHEIYTLEQTQHLFFLLSHLLKHFVAGGVGIRQLCDIIMFIKKYYLVINWDEFKGWLKKYHLEAFWVNLMDLGVRYLAFKPGKYNVPMYNYIEPDSDAILEDMFAAGIFGMSSMARMHSANMTIKAAEDEKTGVVGGLIRSLFPSAESMREKFPYLKKHSYMLPIAYMQRIIKFIKNRNEQSDQGGKSVIELGRERTALLKKYGIVK